MKRAKIAISTNALALLNDDDTFKHLLIDGNDRHTIIIEGSVDEMQKVIVACENAIATNSKAEIVFANTILVFSPDPKRNTNQHTTKI